MFRVPTALENLRNKEYQYQAAVKAFNQANTYPEIIRLHETPSEMPATSWNRRVLCMKG